MYNVLESSYLLEYELNSYLIVGLKSNYFHTYSRADVNNIMIGSGSENMPDLQKQAVVRNVAHPKYDSITLDYDVAVLKVATPFVVSDVRKPIALVKAGEEPADHEPVVVSGWGTNKVSVHVQPSENFVNRESTFKL